MKPCEGMWGREEVRISVSTGGKGEGLGWLGVWYARAREGRTEGLVKELVRRVRGRRLLAAIFCGGLL